MTLTELGKLHHTDKFDIGYLPTYDRYFGPIRDRVRSVLEFGVLMGNSLRMWRDFFPNAIVHGIDINPKTPTDLGERIVVHIGSQEDPAIAKSILDQTGGTIDIILDDGSHIDKLIVASYELYSNHTNMYYVIEDTGCSYNHDIMTESASWPGEKYNDMPRSDWINKRADMDTWINKKIHNIDSGVGPFKALHFHKMTYILEV